LSEFMHGYNAGYSDGVKAEKERNKAAAAVVVRCTAYQTSDQMTCRVCNIAWDMNDPVPPPCPRLSVTK
jgi:hypothetical protein